MIEVLSKEAVQKALRREDTSHPLVDLLECHEDRIIALNEELPAESKYDIQSQVAKTKWGFLIKAVDQVGDYELEPLDIISVWSKTMEVLPDYQYLRYRLAEIFSGFYAVQNLDQRYRNIPSYVFRTGSLPANAQTNLRIINHLDGRLRTIQRSVASIHKYINENGDPGFLAVTCENMGAGTHLYLNEISSARQSMVS